MSSHFGVVCAAADSTVGAGRLGFSVPKRLLPRAVDRNALKRVAREAWRLAPWRDVPRPALAMIRLHRLDAGWKTLPGSTLKKVWRSELDLLVARLLRGTASAPRPAPRDGGDA